MIKRTLLLALLTVAVGATAVADKGMWLPSLISSRIKDMRSKGFRLTAEDIYSINKASLKDAVVCSTEAARARSYRPRDCC